MPVTVKGSGGGSVTLDASTAASDTTLTMPNVSGTILQSGTAVTTAQGGTGLTSPGTSGNVLVSNGTIWTSAAPTAVGINVQSFTGSGTWTKPSGYSASSRVLIQAWAGGGSGGCATGTNSAAAGGGGGAYNERWMTLSQLGATETVTVGAGGTAVTGSTSGNTGGTTTVGSLISAYGGAGGSLASGTNGGGNGGSGGGQLSAGTRNASPVITGNPGGAVSLPGLPWICTGVTQNNDQTGVVNVYQGSALSSNLQTSVTAYNSADALFHGGGGGYGAGGSAGGNDGNRSVWGGGGGGGASGTSTNGAGGTSNFGGNGGAAGASGTAGTQPAGGGGGAKTGGTSGAGGAGQVIITVFPA